MSRVLGSLLIRHINSESPVKLDIRYPGRLYLNKINNGVIYSFKEIILFKIKFIFLWKRNMQRCLNGRKIIKRKVDQEEFIYLFKYRRLNF